MSIEKNKVNLGVCNFPNPLPNKPLFAAIELYDVNSSISLIDDSLVSRILVEKDSAESPPKPGTLCWDESKKPSKCTLSDGNSTVVKSSG